MKQEIILMSEYLKQTQNQIGLVFDRYEEVLESLKDVKLSPTSQIYFVGNGSSGGDSRIASYYALEVFNKIPVCINPYQFVNFYSKGVKAGDLVIATSQTGSSHLVVESVRLANEAKAITIGLSSIQDAPILKAAQHSLLFEEFIENVDYKVTGVLGLLYGLWLTVLGVAAANNLVTDDQVKETIDTFKMINNNYDKLVELAKEWTTKNIDRLEASFTLTVLGSGALTDVASEMAVKSAEIQNRFPVAVDTEEFLHGYCAANTKDNIIMMLVDEASYYFSKKVYDAITERGQSVIWIGYNAPEGDLKFGCKDAGFFNVACFMPVVHSMLVQWAVLKDYGDAGSKLFAYYQEKLNVREE